MRPFTITAITTAALLVAGCAGGTSGDGLRGQTVEVVGTWSGDEQARFEQVIQGFEDKTGVKVTYTAAGDELPTVLETRLQGGTAPNVALVAQPGLVARYATDGKLKPVGPSVAAAVDGNFAGVWKQLGSVNGRLYGVYFKAANKSTVWYSNNTLALAGVSVPKTWEEFIQAARTLSDAGTPAVSVAGADGWTLTDWFENVYLRTAGPQNYDRLSKHELPWTDPTVRTALQTLAQLFGTPQFIEGGSAGALQTEFPKSVTNVFGNPQKAAMVFEGDFVSGVITSSTSAKVGADARFFPFPSVAGSKEAVVAGGDMAVQFQDDAATTALMEYLASAEAAEVWAKLGGFLSPNKNVPAGSYPDDVTRELAQQLVKAGDNVRFDMSDLAPAAFGGTKGAGEWKALQDFLADPSSIDATMQRLEAEAAKAFAA
ncbi:extracellular solute-binding protein [Lentzea sp. BCCO 10_0061]|uniref:Extracellular solute-binding protein n=1 Tax=Lentzea sokolovensis TaxID=3095429 RepID=A0ABU4UPP2_9PSEU|nr:extracellular solute-binding protein [Lentzea sp. BCCO 10_0061]MDX8141384.1 extracellular solute-binding protein [Lentzea sp. BCCO 10_0061]